MKKSFSMIVLAAFVFAPSAVAAKTKIVTIDAHGENIQKSGFIATYDLATGMPHAAIKASKNALKNARDNAKAECDTLGGKLRETLSSKAAMANWSQIDKKEFEATVDFKIDCVVKEIAEKDPSVTDKVGLKPGEVVIGGEVYVKKTVSAAEAR